MKIIKILGTGLNGMVGSRIVELLSDRFEFENIRRSEEVDIIDFEKVEGKIKGSNASIVLHVAAKADVDSCEKDKELGEKGEAWKVNVLATKNIAEACRKFNKKLIYISTDFVFDGKNPPEGGYREDDEPNPIDWYAKTKHEGELAVQKSGSKFIIARIAYPFRAKFDQKKDFMRSILSRLQGDQTVTAVSDQTITPTFIDDIAQAVQILIEKNADGVYHVVGSQSLSPFETAVYIAKEFGCDTNLISKITGEDYFNERALRPFHLALSNAKIGKLGVRMRSFGEALREIKMQITL